MNELLISGTIMFVSSMAQAYFQATIICILFNLEITFSEKVVFSSIVGIVFTLVKLFVPEPIVNFSPIVYIFLFISLFGLYKKIPLLKSILYTLLIMLISVPIEFVSGIIGFKILGLSNNNSDVVATIPILMLITLWYIIIALIIYLIKRKKHISFQFNSSFVRN